MIGGRRMASRTILPTDDGVIKDGIGKVGGIGMTGRASAGPMVGGRCMTTCAILRADG